MLAREKAFNPSSPDPTGQIMESRVLRREALHQVPRYAARLALVTALYWVVAKLSLLAAIPPGYASSVWPPSGLALAALLLLGRRYWPAVWIGAATVNLTIQSSLVAAVLIGTGNSLEALLGAALIERLIGPLRRFRHPGDIFKFVMISGAAAAVAATVGALAVTAATEIQPAEAMAIWWTWWQGDVSGMIIVAPLILSWTIRTGAALALLKRIELTALAATLMVAGYAVFGSDLANRGFSPLLLALTLPFVIWAGLRFDQRYVTSTIAVLCAFAVGYTVLGRGPLVGGSLHASLFQLLVFISIVAVTGLEISAVVGERRRAMEALRRSRDELELRVAQRTRELHDSEESFRLLVDGIRDYAIFMLDPQGRIVSWNKGAEKIHGYAVEEIVGKHFSCFYARDGTERFRAQQKLETARAQGRFEDEDWRVRKDGTRFWANSILTPLYDAPGRLRGFAEVTRDLSQQRRIEALEREERRLHQFLAMLGHELRNPLAPIKMALELMRIRPAETATVAWARNVIDQQVVQLTRLVDDLLDVGRITSGKVVLRREPVDLNAVVLQAVESCRAPADEKHHALDVAYATEPLLVDGDLVRLSQVITNLLNNAIKYTPPRGRIALTLARQEGSAVVRVKDNGVGLSEDLLPSVFDLFVQGERTLARTEGGLGIGLTVVRQLVELHGGTVIARSDGIDRGAEFVVALPALEYRAPTHGPVATRNSTAALLSRRILVVDDNRDLTEAAAFLLTTCGHDVRTAFDGQAALEIAREFQPEVVLLDIGLPEMDGYEVARRLRVQFGARSPVLVAVTGYGQNEDRIHALQRGFDHHLVKPVELQSLEAILQSIPAAAHRV